MKTANFIAASNNIIANKDIFICLFASSESAGTCTVETYQSVSTLMSALEDISVNKRSSTVFNGSDVDLSTKEDIHVAIDYEDKDCQTVQCRELDIFLGTLAITGLSI